MRIYGNRQIKTLPGLATRPTPARVREALFNIWQDKITGCRWLDLCCGSGAMGAEALCRGAGNVIGIEQSGQACALIRQNWRRVSNSDQTFQVFRGDVTRQLNRVSGQQFDLIYFDPPYASNLYQPVLVAISQHQLLAPKGELAVEHQANKPFQFTTTNLLAYQTRLYGNTALTFYRSRIPTNSQGTSKT